MTIRDGLKKALVHAQVFGCTLFYKSSGNATDGFEQEWTCPEHGHIVTLRLDWDKAAHDIRVEAQV